ncbi:MAG: flagellar basal body rod protein FlgC [Acidobacteriaceae bacterium]|nr:flagellar basal body rod protein FlgC [Acidobacteriaceae bacterium]
MNLFGMMDISGSALKAERVRAEVVASNMANAETTRTADGTPYRRQHVVFAANGDQSFSSIFRNSAMSGSALQAGAPIASASVEGGVQVSAVVDDSSAPLTRFEPGHPDADANGFVSYPNINPLTEMVDLMGATRAYGANASAVQAEKNMVNSSLDILKS